MREVIITIFEGCAWFKFNSLELALGINSNCYTSVTKMVKTKSQKVLWG